jgi:hypothetical protein
LWDIRSIYANHQQVEEVLGYLVTRRLIGSAINFARITMIQGAYYEYNDVGPQLTRECSLCLINIASCQAKAVELIETASGKLIQPWTPITRQTTLPPSKSTSRTMIPTAYAPSTRCEGISTRVRPMLVVTKQDRTGLNTLGQLICLVGVTRSMATSLH